MKKEVVSVLFLWGILISLGFISASTAISCNIVPKADCNSSVSGVPILNLSASSNAHGELVNATGAGASSYPYSVCCYNMGSSILRTCTDPATDNNSIYAIQGISVPSNKVIGLYSQTNSHAESTGLTYYTNDVCNSGLNNCQNVSSSANCASLGGNYLSVVNLSAPTNAHIGSGGTQICCAVTGLDSGTLSCKLKNATWGDVTGATSGYSNPLVALNNNNVTMIANGTDCSGASVSLYIYNSSGLQLGPMTGIFPSGNGNMSYQWHIPASSRVIAQGKYVFEAEVVGGGSTIWSNSTVGGGPLKDLQIYPQKVDCTALGGKANAYNESGSYYPGTDPTMDEMRSSCFSDPCNIAHSIADGLKHTGSNWIYGLDWNWTSADHSSGTCNYWEGLTTSPTVPSCPPMTTLCYNVSNTANPYFCASTSVKKGTCPLDPSTGYPMNPPTLTTCTVGAGCVSPVCGTGGQDSCVSGATCYKTLSGGLCYNYTSTRVYPGEFEEAGGASGTVMTFSSDGSWVSVSLPADSNYTTTGGTIILSNGGILNITFANSMTAMLTPSGSGPITLSGGSEVATPNDVLVTLGTGGATAYFPIGTKTYDSLGTLISTSSTALIKYISKGNVPTVNQIDFSSSLPTEVQTGTPYSGSITASGGDGGPYTYSIAVNGSSQWLSINSNGNVANSSYVPSVTSNTTYMVNITAADSSGNIGLVSYILTVTPGVPNGGNVNPINLNIGGLKTMVQQGTSYTGTVSASGGDSGPYTYSIAVNGSSQWLSVDPSTGSITGTAPSPVTQDTPYMVNITAADSSGNLITKGYTLTVTVGAPAQISINVNPSTSGVPKAGESQILCLSGQTGALYPYSGISCPTGDFNAQGNCALDPTSGSTCSAGLTCTSEGSGTGYCHDNSIIAGKCVYHTVSTSGNCSSSGLIEYNWTTSWTGSGAKPSWCKKGSQVFTCPAQIKLSVFNAYNAIEAIVVLALIYVAIVLLRKKKSSRRKGTTSKNKQKK